MLIDDAKDLVRQYVERVWTGGDQAALDQLTTSGFSYHLGGQPARDRAETAQFLRDMRVAFPDWRVEIADLIAEGNRVAVRWHGLVTHGGPFRGFPATGRRVAVSGINVYRIDGDRIVGEWEQMDSVGMLQQLGALPSKAPS